MNKTNPNRLGFALLLKFFQLEARFPHHQHEVPQVVVQQLARQLGMIAELYLKYDWNGRTIKRHRAQIRAFLGFREATTKDSQAVDYWLTQQVLRHEHDLEHLKAEVYQQFRQRQIEPPTPERVERLIHSAIHTYEQRFFAAVMQQLSALTRVKLDKLLSSAKVLPNSVQEEQSYFQELKADPGRSGLESILNEITKLQYLHKLSLPSNLFQDVAPKVLFRYRQRTATESLHELRRHPDPIRYMLLTAFCWLRCQEVTDSLVELLIQIVHGIGARAERKVEKELIDDLKRVSGKNSLLFRIAEATVDNPNGVVKDVVYPVVSKQTLQDLVKEFKATGPTYREKVYTLRSCT